VHLVRVHRFARASAVQCIRPGRVGSVLVRSVSALVCRRQDQRVPEVVQVVPRGVPASAMFRAG
jgi:hypothetical protein